jgi:LPS O-antigen subunit length determinant protein (WzzB/FepE family)
MKSSPPKENTRLVSDEIDLIDLFETLWSGRWRLVITCFAAILVGLVFHVGFNKMITAKCSVSQISPIEMGNFRVLDELKIVDKLSSEDLIEMYYECMSSFDNMKVLIEKYNLLENPMEGEEYRQQIVEFAEKRIHLNLLRPSSNQNFKTRIQVEIKHVNNGEIRSIIETLLSRASEQQRSEILQEFEHAIKNLEESQNFEIEKTKLHIDAVTKKYFEEKADEIEILSKQILTLRESYANRKQDIIHQLTEQTAIARSLNIDKPFEVRYDQIPGNAVITQFNAQEQPLYLRGYLALEREIELTEARTEDDSFIPELRDLESKLLNITNRQKEEAYIPGLRYLQEKLFLLENDATIARAEKLVNELIRNNPSLRFASLDIDQISLKESSGVNIVLFALFAGFGVGCLWVFILAAVRSHDLRDVELAD